MPNITKKPAQSAAATSDIEESTTTTTTTTKPAAKATSQSETAIAETAAAAKAATDARLGALLQTMTDVPESVLKSVIPKPQAEESETEEGAAAGTETETSTETEASTETTETEAGTTTPQSGAAEPEIDKPIPKEWDPEARAQVLEDRRKRKERTKERDAWQKTAQQIFAQLQDVSSRYQKLLSSGPARTPQTTPSDPLGDITDLQELDQALAQANEMQEWCEANPNGAEGVIVGWDKQGREIRKDLDAQEVQKRLNWSRRRVLAGAKKRESLQATIDNAVLAQQLYPNLFKPGTLENSFANEVLANFPELLRNPEYPLWLGRLAEGTRAELAKAKAAGKQTETNNGEQPANKRPPSKAAQALLNAPKVKAAPSATRTKVASEVEVERGSSNGSSQGEKEALERFAASGGDENAHLNLIQDLRSSGRGSLVSKREALLAAENN